MIVFAVFSILGAGYSVLYAAHSIRCRRAAASVGAMLLAALGLSLALLMFLLLRY